MHKRMIEACKQKIKVTKEARVEITNLKENFRIMVANLKKDSKAWIS